MSADGSRFIPVEGTLGPDNRLNAIGNGSYEGFPTEARMTVGFRTESRSFSGEYGAGTNGSLPGNQPIVWNVMCIRQ